MTSAVGRRAVGRRQRGVRSRDPRRTVPRRAGDRVTRGAAGRNCVRFGLGGGAQGTVARLSVEAVAGGPVVPGTMASASR